MNWRTPARIFLIPVVSILLGFRVWDLIIRIFNVEPFVAPSPGEALGAPARQLVDPLAPRN
ncbi:MAG: hypothetical protein JHD05_08265 [Thermoleophilia bacterium]|nr:hypothetical protein [Thermoleophilia bacterium]